jgi:signal transduction histidine kinase
MRICSGMRLSGHDREDHISRSANLIHELQVHQIELKMQNEELRRIQGELEKGRDQYSHLCDFSPVGYVTLTEKGIIHEANPTLASIWTNVKLSDGSLIAIGIDISERKSAEDQIRLYLEKLERSNQELQDFAFAASHDLQEPLRKIQSFGSLVATSKTPSAYRGSTKY